MPFDQQAQFVPGIIRLVYLFPEPPEHLFGFIPEEVHHDIFFIFEIKIDGPIGHTSFSGYFGNGRLMISVAGKHLDSRFENAVVFIVFIAGTDGLTPA